MTQTSQPEIEDDLILALRNARKGDQAAWQALFDECYPKVRRVVRRRMDRSMRSLYDSTDFANDALENLAANIDQLDFPSVNSLVAFLAQVAEQKVIDEYRRQHTLKRDVTRDRPIMNNEAAGGRRSISHRMIPRPASLRKPTRCMSDCWRGPTRPSERSLSYANWDIRRPTLPNERPGIFAKCSGSCKISTIR